MNFTPTPEQVAIVEAAAGTRDNLLISALAGAAKTSTLDLIARKLTAEPILSLAFNKRIAEEMTKRLPAHVKAATLNSVGHRAWAATSAKRITLDTRKTATILRGIYDELSPSARSDAWDQNAEYSKAISSGKSLGYIPDGLYPSAKRLIGDREFFDALDDDLDRDIIREAFKRSIVSAYEGTIDFDDQLYMPTLFGGTFPKFPLVLVDETQDLSPLNHAMLAILATRRIIAVGDRLQSIYAFRGADSYSMTSMQSRFNMKELQLSVSFRCPEEIVKHARVHAPHMQWAKPGGSVTHLTEWDAASIPDGAAILCRNNAPLYSAAMALLARRRGVNVVGRELGPQLTRAMLKLGKPEMKQDDLLKAIDKWEQSALATKKNKASTKDRADCFRVFAGFAPTLGGAVAHAKHMFDSTGTINLLSGHKAKGLEWDTVYHLDSHRIPSPFAETPSDLQQESNLDYVITTRAKSTLNYVTRETLN